MITERDERVIRFLNSDRHKAARTSDLAAIFYGGRLRVAQRRLKQLCNRYKLIDRKRDFYSIEWVYLEKGWKIQQWKHTLLLTQFLAKLTAVPGYKYIDSRAEYSIGEIRADAVLIAELNGEEEVFFIEIHTHENHSPLDIEKYKKLYYTDNCIERWGYFPRIIIVTDRPDRSKDFPELELKYIREDFSNIGEVFQ